MTKNLDDYNFPYGTEELAEAWVEKIGDADDIAAADLFIDDAEVYALTIRTVEGGRWLVMTQTTAEDLIASDLEDDDAGWKVDARILAETTRIDAAVFEVLMKEFAEGAGRYIGQILSATEAYNRVADRVISADHGGDWFASYDGVAHDLGSGIFAYRRN